MERNSLGCDVNSINSIEHIRVIMQPNQSTALIDLIHAQRPDLAGA